MISKANIYKSLLDDKIIKISDSLNDDKLYNLYVEKIFNYPILFDNITLYIEHIIKTKNLIFDKICSSSINSIPYVTNVATTLNKPFCYSTLLNNDIIPHDIKNIKIQGSFKHDETYLIIETFISSEILINNLLTKIRLFNNNICGIIIIFDICEGEYINLLQQKENIFNLFNLNDILIYYETNNLIDLFISEKIKYTYETKAKNKIKQLNN